MVKHRKTTCTEGNNVRNLALGQIRYTLIWPGLAFSATMLFDQPIRGLTNAQIKQIAKIPWNQDALANTQGKIRKNYLYSQRLYSYNCRFYRSHTITCLADISFSLFMSITFEIILTRASIHNTNTYSVSSDLTNIFIWKPCLCFHIYDHLYIPCLKDTYIYLCRHAHMHMHLYIFMHFYLHLSIHGYKPVCLNPYHTYSSMSVIIHAYLHNHAWLPKHTYRDTYTHINTHLCLHTYIDLCKSTCKIHIYIPTYLCGHKYIHTYTYIHACFPTCTYTYSNVITLA